MSEDSLTRRYSSREIYVRHRNNVLLMPQHLPVTASTATQSCSTTTQPPRDLYSISFLVACACDSSKPPQSTPLFHHQLISVYYGNTIATSKSSAQHRIFWLDIHCLHKHGLTPFLNLCHRELAYKPDPNSSSMSSSKPKLHREPKSVELAEVFVRL